jgi:hypothetical protein
MDLDRLWKLLEVIQTLIRAFDTKAQIVIAADGIMAGVLGTQAGGIATVVALQGWRPHTTMLVAFAGVCFLLLVTSLVFATLTVQPRLNIGQPRSRLFFAHLAADFGRNYAATRKALMEMTDEDQRADLSNQVQANAIICTIKSDRFRRALFTMAFGLAFWFLTLTLNFVVLRLAAVPHANTVMDSTGQWP